MTSTSGTPIKIPAAVESFLADAHGGLRHGKIARLRLCPLILQKPIETLFVRRPAPHHQTPYGYTVTFKRHLKKSTAYPEGQLFEGTFDLLVISEKILVVASSLVGDAHKYGPQRFVDKAYPLARRPFFQSGPLVRLIETFAASHAWSATTVDVTGYDRVSRKLRRDRKAQSPAAAALEMAEQGRHVHRFLVAFRDDKGCEATRLSFDRYATVRVEKGDPNTALRELLFPGLEAAREATATYKVTRAPDPINQELLELEFQGEPFGSYDSMRTLCNAVRQGDGLNVSIIHLNPYLQAQVLDFFTGAVIEMLVTDTQTLSLIPRSPDCAVSMERVATTIYDHFSEARSKRTKMADTF